MAQAKTTFEILANVDCSGHIDKKGKFSFVSWAWAWALVKQKFPNATFVKHTFNDNQDNPLPFMRDTKGHTYVEVSVTIEDNTQSEIFPVSDNYNQAITHPDSMAVNTALQRALVKCLAYHGLGLSLYAGEDLPVMGDHGDDINRIINLLANSKTKEDCDQIFKAETDLIKRLTEPEKADLRKSYTNAKSRIAAQETKQAA